MADASQLQLNPYALFDPSQWQNPFSNYQSSALPAASYAGVPTDFAGNPIQMPAGMTINQTPSQPQAAPPAAQPQPAAPFRMATTSEGMPPGQVNLGRGVIGQSWQRPQQQQPTQPTVQTLQATPQANSAGLTPQQYMQLRANPGPVPIYGANVPQSASSAQPGPGVLQSFLQNWKPAQSGAGSGFQQGFAQALKNQGYG